MSSDGAMVPLVGGVWAEVKLVAIGTVERRQPRQGGQEETVTTHLSYCARMTDATTFADQASAQVRRRGVERATEVCALQDGAEWIPGFVRSHRSDALCILDFAQAASYVHQIGEQVRAARGHLPTTWEEGILHRLKHDGPARVLDHLSWLAQRFPQVQGEVTYLLKRRGMLDYPTYRAAGWPIGSGSVESSHKLVMQARLKGPGMHWKPEHVNPMLALRGALLNDRWQETWTEQVRWRVRQQFLRRRTRQQQRFHQQQATQPLEPPAPAAPVEPPRKTGRTEAQHRWGRYTISRRRLQQAGGAK